MAEMLGLEDHPDEPLSVPVPPAARIALSVFVAVLTVLAAPTCLLTGDVPAFLAVLFLGSLGAAMAWPDAGGKA